MPKLYFSRLHLTSPEVIDKKNFYFDGIKSAAQAGHGDYAYKIIEVQTQPHSDFIIGTLVKYDPKGRGEVLNEKEGKAEKGGTKNSIIAKSIFIIQVSESVIAFKESNALSKKMFINMFNELFKINHSGKLFDFSMSSITEPYSFVTKVESLKEVKKITLSLVPSNPRNADIWKKMDERLRDNQISRYSETQESNRPGGIKVDDETKSKMHMAEDGYGVSTVLGIDDSGTTISVTTNQKNKEVAAVLPNELESKGTFDEIIKYLEKTFKSISDRTKKA